MPHQCKHDQSHHSGCQNVASDHKAMVVTKRLLHRPTMCGTSRGTKAIAGKAPKGQPSLFDAKNLPDGKPETMVAKKVMATPIIVVVASLPDRQRQMYPSTIPVIALESLLQLGVILPWW